jgi:potassium-transporting ATPase KdpC subunit
MKKNLLISVLMTIVTTVLFGLIYPLVVTGLAQLFMKDKANGQLIVENATTVGSRIIGQPFSAPRYFHSRPSAAGNGYDSTNSGASNLGPTNHALMDRVSASVAAAEPDDPGVQVPVDLVTTSGSGLDPDISPAAAAFQISRVARERGMNEEDLRRVVTEHTQGRQLGFLGEPRVNVLELNLALDLMGGHKAAQSRAKDGANQPAAAPASSL